ncbi:MAG: type VI secretion system tube protein TssD [Parabacteroides sp.]|nr:type VI secretion system tube protein TssD [Parabacteroides sp.]
MSLFATLEIGDNHVGIYNKQYQVVHCQYKFARGYNYRKPDTVTRNKSIEITVVAPGKEDLSLYDWYISKSVLSGRIVFDMSGQLHSDGQPKILQFENAHCFSLSESYHIDKPRRRIIRLEITAEESIVDSVPFTNY